VALKIKELTRIVTEPYSSADFLHGPISVLEHGFPLIVIAPSGRTLDDLGAFIANVKQRGAETVAISDHPGILEQADIGFQLPSGTPEWLSPLTAVLPGQMIAMQLTISKGLDPDSPKGLTKVTETH